MSLNFTKRIALVRFEQSGPEAHDKEEVVISRPWAAIKTMKGSEIQALGADANQITSRFIIRYKEDVTPDMQIKYKGNYYDIQSFANDDEQNRTITIIASAAV